jgi:hypothetical protein
MNYHTKKKGGEFPSFVHDDGEMIDVEDDMLLGIVSKILNVASKKEVRGSAPGYIEKKATKKSVKKTVKKSLKKKEPEKEKPKTNNEPEQKTMSKLVEEAERAKCEQEIYKAAKLKNDLEASRNKLISRELVADVMVAYLDSLSKEIMQMPVSVIQEIAAGIEAGKSNIELVNDLRKHLSTAVANTKRTSINTMKRLLK